jgi:hypothetical protein
MGSSSDKAGKLAEHNCDRSDYLLGAEQAKF